MVFKNNIFKWLCLIAVVSYWGCKEETQPWEPAADLNFFPLAIGKQITYQVDSVFYDDFNNTVDSSTFHIKEQVTDTFTDNSGNLNFSIWKYRRDNASAPWVFQRVDTRQIRNGQTAESTDGNQRYVKLSFPVNRRTRWDGLAYVDRDTFYQVRNASLQIFKDWEDLFYYSNVNEPFNINGFQFDSTTVIVQADAENNIELRYSIERYARSVGMVYKEIKILDSQCIAVDPTCLTRPWEERAEKGYIIKMAVLDYN